MISFTAGVIEEAKKSTDKADRQKTCEISSSFHNREIAHHFSLVFAPSFPEAIASILRLFALVS